jgi:SAM-dependent methyltransferase
MKGRPRSSGSSSPVRFWGSERGAGHERWYRAFAVHYDALYVGGRAERAGPFLQDLFRRRGPVADVLDVGCGTFALDLPLLRRGYRIVGRDFSAAMIRVARERLARARRTVDLAVADMRALDLGRNFDAILCLGTAFNYLTSRDDAARALRGFRRHLGPGGLLVLDLTNFAAWIRRPQNARAEVDYRAPDGTRIAVFGFNDQDTARGIHVARWLTVLSRRGRINVWFDEAPLRIWTRDGIRALLVETGFSPAEWWGDLRLGSRYVPSRSPRLVSVSVRG